MGRNILQFVLHGYDCLAMTLCDIEEIILLVTAKDKCPSDYNNNKNKNSPVRNIGRDQL